MAASPPICSCRYRVLYADLEAGRGSVRLSDEFDACSSACQYSRCSTTGWRRSSNAGCVRCDGCTTSYPPAKPGEPAERLARFRATIEAMGVDLPAGFEVPEPTL